MGAVRTSQGIITTTPSAFVTCRAATGAKGCSVSHNWESARERWTAVSCEAAAAMLAHLKEQEAHRQATIKHAQEEKEAAEQQAQLLVLSGEVNKKDREIEILRLDNLRLMAARDSALEQVCGGGISGLLT